MPKQNNVNQKNDLHYYNNFLSVRLELTFLKKYDKIT